MAETKEHAPAGRRPDRIIIRPWPKVIFLYPTMVYSLLAWIVSYLFAGPSHPGLPRTLGILFCAVFGLNLLVFSFDFSRIKSLTILFVLVAVIFGIGWANTKWEVMASIRALVEKIDVRMNTQFYGFMAVFLLFIFTLVFVNTRFNYFEITRNEILHHHGYLGDITRTPTTAMRMQKEIYDLMEYLLLRSGRLIFYPSTTREALVIDNVVKVNEVEKRIKDLLSSVSVALRTHESGAEEDLSSPI